MSSRISGPISLHRKVAIVTGAARGSGLAVADALAREGADVAVADVLALDQAVGAVQSHGRRAVAVPTDVSSETAVKALVGATVTALGGVDILICCAGVYGEGDFASVDVEEWQRVININLLGAYLCLREVFPRLRERGGGKVVCVGSVAGENGGYACGPQYSASKGGLHALSRWAAKNGAPEIYVNVIAPGALDTEMIRGRGYPPDISPLRRQGRPVDIAEAAVFLASDASNYTTGTVLYVDGGYHTQ
jgi:3-oxoacyl-[acyl-carrier protein] reductase